MVLKKIVLHDLIAPRLTLSAGRFIEQVDEVVGVTICSLQPMHRVAQYGFREHLDIFRCPRLYKGERKFSTAVAPDFDLIAWEGKADNFKGNRISSFKRASSQNFTHCERVVLIAPVVRVSQC